MIVPAEGALLEQILDSSHALWNDGLSRAAYGRWWQAQLRTRWGRTHLHRYALVEGDRVLASAKRYDLDAMFDGRPLRVMGIGAVFTQPEMRGRGHARTLIRELLEDGSVRGFDAALLWSEIGADLYSPLGFEPVAVREQRLTVTEKAGAPATLVRAGDDRDLAAIAAIGRDGAGRFRFHLVRDVDLIHYSLARRRLFAGLGPHGARELQFFVSEEGTSAVAYIVISVHRNEWTIEECGDRDPSGARVGAILQVLLAREPSERRPTIRGWLPPGFAPPQTTIQAEQPALELMMVRSLGATKLPTLDSRAVLYWHADVF